MVTNRKGITLRYRIFTLFAVLAVAVLSWIAVFAFGNTAHAEEPEQGDIAVQAVVPSHDSVFGANHAKSKAFSLSDEEIVYPNMSYRVFYYLKPGTYHLTEDVAIASSFEVDSGFLKDKGLIADDSITVNICLHGHSIRMSYDDEAFSVDVSDTLNIYDCGGADNCGEISGGYGIRVDGTFNMYGGTICDAEGYAHGVYISGSGTFNMYDGAIKNNRSAMGAGGVEINGGKFNMYGGTISDNSTDWYYGGAGVRVAGGTFHMYGGSITNNFIDTKKASADQDFSMWYYGAGVCVSNEETFFVEGDVNITGNFRGTGNSKSANNVHLFRSHNPDGTRKEGCYLSEVRAPKIEIAGKLGANAQIGVTVEEGVFTNGYTTAGNTQNPSKYFRYDGGVNSGFKIGFDNTGKEGAVLDNNDSGTYKMQSAVVTGAAGATVGDTKVKFTIDVTLVNTADSTKTQTQTEIYEHTLSSRLKSGTNKISFNYTYQGVTKALSYDVVPLKYKTYVVWSCNGTQRGQNEYRRYYDGTDVKDSVRATYTGYDGEKVRIEGMTDQVILQDENGNRVTSTAKPGTYFFHLVGSDEYAFDNNTLTLEVVPSYAIVYKMKDAEVAGVVGSPQLGDSTIRVRVKVTLVEVDDNTSETTKTFEQTVTPTPALKVGSNTVKFTYTYGDDSKELSVTFNVSKKNSAITWYYNSVVVGSSLKHAYDGVDASSKIVATYDGIDGKRKRVAASSDNMIKKDANGKTVTSLKEVGVYTLSLKELSDYEFSNNTFTYEVVEKPEDLSDLIYKENGTMIMGVSTSGTFENGTELKLETATVTKPNGMSGEISAAYNVKFVKDSATVTPSGKFTVNMYIPRAVRDKTYKVYNLKNGKATELNYTPNGDYATFEATSLDCILFVLESDEPPVDPIGPIDPNDPDDPYNQPDDPDDPNDNNGDDPTHAATLDDGGLLWLWVVLIVLAVIIIVVIIVVIIAKRNKQPKAAKESKPANTEKKETEQKPTKRCSGCGRENKEDATFCVQCGKEFD